MEFFSSADLRWVDFLSECTINKSVIEVTMRFLKKLFSKRRNYALLRNPIFPASLDLYEVCGQTNSAICVYGPIEDIPPERVSFWLLKSDPCIVS